MTWPKFESAVRGADIVELRVVEGVEGVQSELHLSALRIAWEGYSESLWETS